MIASEHCTDSLYDSQYHPVKMTSEYNFKTESNLLLTESLNNSATNMTSSTSSSSPSSSSSQSSASLISCQPHYHHQMNSAAWYHQQPTVSTNNSTYSTDDLFYAGLPPPPPAPPLFTFPSPLPKKKQMNKRNHPRHHSANGILQQYAHYHHPQQQQQHVVPTNHHLQRQSSNAATTTTTTTPPPPPPHSSHMSNHFSTSTSPSTATTHSMNYPSTSPPSCSPTDSTFSSLSPTASSFKRSHPQQHHNAMEKSSSIQAPSPLRFQIALQASTAAAQRFSESSSLTYLNRGQAYGIHFQDQQHHQLPEDALITSTISITFHDATHRQASQNYWRFWLSQQDRPNEARALDLDAQQSSGLVHVHYPSFDRITFQWHSHLGATLFVRFNCLSTDFSRIKGVKGIPLRALVESSCASTALSTPPSASSTSSPPSASPLPSPTQHLSNPDSPGTVSKFTEKSFCKIKLFRDKGAERKNKDDAKQIAKQLEKLKAEGNPQHNPLWHFYTRPVSPYSAFEPLPEEDDIVKDECSLAATIPLSTTVASATSLPLTMNATAGYALPPPPLLLSQQHTVSSSSPLSTSSTSPSSSSPSSIVSNAIIPPMQPLVHNNNASHSGNIHQHDGNMTMMSSFYPSSFQYPSQFVQPSSSYIFNPVTSPPLSSGYPPQHHHHQQQQHYQGHSQQHHHQQQQSSWPVPAGMASTSPAVGMKRSRSHMVASTSDHPSPPEDQAPTKRQYEGAPALTLFVDTKKDQPSMELKRIELDTLTVRNLISKLSALLSLQANSITEVLWRRDPATSSTLDLHHQHQHHPHKKSALSPSSSSSSPSSSTSNLMVLVEDSVLEHFPDQTIMTVQWEISSAGMVRLILDF